MDLVYVCRNGENEELRYSIRSAVANLQFDNLWVVGGKPDWYGGNYIETKYRPSSYTQVWENLFGIINNPEISDDFILMNDDFFIMYKTNNVEYYYNLTLEEFADYRKQKIGEDSLYINKLIETSSKLSARHGIHSPKNYELHIPMVLNKEKLRDIISMYPLYRSAYGNIHKVGGTQTRDVKVYVSEKMLPLSFDYMYEFSNYLSTDDLSFDLLRETLLEKAFPIPSQYELDR